MRVAARGIVTAMLLASACAGLPGAVKPPEQPFAPTPAAAAPVVRARVCGHKGTALPEGWRLPALDEVSDAWRSADRDRFLLADADLDGDGRPDQARVLVRTDRSAFGVFVFLCREHGAVDAHLVLHNRDLAYFKGIGIKPVAPGRYRTACGRGYIDCYTGEPQEVHLPHAAIDYFKNESVTSLFYWSDSARAFKWVAISD